MNLRIIVYKLGRLLHRLVANQVFVNVVSCQFDNLLQDKVILITGAYGGLGKAFSEKFLENGASIIIAGRNFEKLKQCKWDLIAKSRSYENKISCIELDQLAPESFYSKIKEASEKFGRIDILVNNAGVITKGMPETSIDDWDRVIETNLKGTYFLSQHFITYLRDNKIEGNILNVSSSSALRPAYSPYSISKWGINGLTLGLAKIGVKYGITVNAIAPGPTATPMLRKKNGNNISLPFSPIGRFAKPEEIANMAVMLISCTGKTIVGDTIYMTGGAGVLTYDDDEIQF